MRLAEYTDYTLRVLMYCAVHRQGLVTIGELAAHHRLSKNHLMKVVNDLARQGLIETVRGRGGGLRLLKAPESIRIGDVVRASETDFRLVECFDARTNSCSLTPSCRLKPLFDTALSAFFRELDGATLADIVAPRQSPASPRPRAAAPLGRAMPIAAPAARPVRGATPPMPASTDQDAPAATGSKPGRSRGRPAGP